MYVDGFIILTHSTTAGLLLLLGWHAYISCLRFVRGKCARNTQKFGTPSNSEFSISNWPDVLVQLPVFNEQNSIRELLDCCSKLKYEGHVTIQVLDDSTDQTSEVIERWLNTYLADKNITVQHVKREDRKGYKAGALKNGLKYDDSEYIAIFDADFRPSDDFLIRAMNTLLKQPKLGLIQGRWTYLNESSNLLTHIQAIGMDAHFAVEQPARAWNDFFMNFNGTAGVWRRQCIIDGGNWQSDTLTEDLDLSYRSQLAGWKLDYQLDLECPSEIPDNIGALKSQQSRWVKGSIQTAIKLLPDIVKSDARVNKKIEAIFHLCHAIVNPLLLVNFFTSCYLLSQSLHNSPIHNNLWALCIVLACFGPSFLYRFSQKILEKKNQWGGLLYPTTITLGCGLALNNSIAFIQAFRKQTGTFDRTPKKGDQSKTYLNSTNFYFVGEILLGLLGSSVIVLTPSVNYILKFFVLIYSLGFTIVGLTSALQLLLNYHQNNSNLGSTVDRTSKLPLNQ